MTEQDSPIRVFLVDDQAMIRAAFRSLLEEQPGFEVVGDSGEARVAIDEIAARAGITMIPDAGIQGSVDLNFTDISLDDALETLLKQHDLVLLPGPGNVYFVERNDDPTQVTEFIQLVKKLSEKE